MSTHDLSGSAGGREIGQLLVPIVGKHQQGAVELFLLRIFLERRIGGIRIAEHHLGHLAVVDARRAVPRLHDELVVRLHVAENQHVDVRLAVDRENLVDRRHPSAQQAFPALAQCWRDRRRRRLQLRKILVGMVRARVAAGVDRGGVEALLGADEGIPRVGATTARRIPTAEWRLGLGATGLPISGAASRTWISSGSPPPASSLSASRSGSEAGDLLLREAEERRRGLREDGLRPLRHHPRRAARRHERERAIALAQVLIHLPGRIVVRKFALQRVARSVRRFGLLAGGQHLRDGGGQRDTFKEFAAVHVCTPHCCAREIRRAFCTYVLPATFSVKVYSPGAAGG